MYATYRSEVERTEMGMGCGGRNDGKFDKKRCRRGVGAGAGSKKRGFLRKLVLGRGRSCE